MIIIVCRSFQSAIFNTKINSLKFLTNQFIIFATTHLYHWNRTHWACCASSLAISEWQSANIRRPRNSPNHNLLLGQSVSRRDEEGSAIYSLCLILYSLSKPHQQSSPTVFVVVSSMVEARSLSNQRQSRKIEESIDSRSWSPLLFSRDRLPKSRSSRKNMEEPLENEKKKNE